MHILFLSDNFPPEVNAPASRTFEHCREWAGAGHRVTVVTCAPNFPKGKVYPGYRNLPWQTESMDGIRIVRVWSYIAANEGFARRILDYTSYMVSAFLASPLVGKADVVVATSPQFFTACAGWAVSRLKNTPFVFELRDLWPESVKAVGAMRDSALIRMLESAEMALYRNAARVVSVTESFKNVLVRRGIDAGKIEVVTNGVDMNRFRPQPKDPEVTARLGLAGKFVAGYIGTHGMAHALETILEAARILAAESGREAFRFLFLGDGAQKDDLLRQAHAQGLTNVLFLDSVPKEQVTQYWSVLDVSIIHLKKTELFTTVIPSKLFECMAMGIPILLGVAGESASIVEQTGCGLLFEPENAGDLCDKLRALQADPALCRRLAANGRAGAHRYDRKTLAQRMLSILEAAADDCR
jgi:glycosyltransferase involved in cell wall biosynthesis